MERQRLAERHVIDPSGDADDDRRTHRTEGHRRALQQHAHQYRRHRREAHGHQQRRDYRRRRTEAGSTFDEAAEQPADDHHLNARVGADGREAGTNGRNTT